MRDQSSVTLRETPALQVLFRKSEIREGQVQRKGHESHSPKALPAGRPPAFLSWGRRGDVRLGTGRWRCGCTGPPCDQPRGDEESYSGDPGPEPEVQAGGLVPVALHGHPDPDWGSAALGRGSEVMWEQSVGAPS